MSQRREKQWPEYPNCLALPTPGTVPAEFRAFNAETLGHYRYTNSVRWPVDKQRALFNVRDYCSLQEAVDAAAAYSAANGKRAAVVQFDTNGGNYGTVNVPNDTTLLFKGHNHHLSDQGTYQFNVNLAGNYHTVGFADLVMQGDLTYAGTAGGANVHFFDGSGLIGRMTHTATGSFFLRAAGAKLDIRGFDVNNLFAYLKSSFLRTLGSAGAAFQTPKLQYLSMQGCEIYAQAQAGAPANLLDILDITNGVNVFVTASTIQANGGASLFRFGRIAQARIGFHGNQHNALSWIDTADTATVADTLSVIANETLFQGGSPAAPYVRFGATQVLKVDSNLVSGTPGILDQIASVGYAGVSVQENSYRSFPENVPGGTTPIRISGAQPANAIISNNQRIQYISAPPTHFVENPGGGGNYTMIGNRVGFTTAIATNAPGIGGGLNI